MSQSDIVDSIVTVVLAKQSHVCGITLRVCLAEAKSIRFLVKEDRKEQEFLTRETENQALQELRASTTESSYNTPHGIFCSTCVHLLLRTLILTRPF